MQRWRTLLFSLLVVTGCTATQPSRPQALVVPTIVGATVVATTGNTGFRYTLVVRLTEKHDVGATIASLGLAFNGAATLGTINISNPFSGDLQPSGTLDSRTIVIVNDPGTTIATSVTAYVSGTDWNNNAYSTNGTGPITAGTTAAAIRR